LELQKVVEKMPVGTMKRKRKLGCSSAPTFIAFDWGKISVQDLIEIANVGRLYI
jgi:hypothetical protein